MKGLYLRGNTYWFAFKREGHYYRLSTQETDEARAILVAREIRNQPQLAASDHLYREIDAYVKSLKDTNRRPNTYEGIRVVLRPWAEHMGPERLLSEINPRDIQAWFNAKRKVVIDNTAVAYLGVLSAFFKWALAKKKVRSNPCNEVIIPKVRQRYRDNWIDKDAAKRLIDNCQDPELKYILFCALHAGMRKGETTMSRPEWFNLRRGFVRIPAEDGDWKPKDGCARTVPLSPKFQSFLTFVYPPRYPFMIAPEALQNGWHYRFDFKFRFNAYVRSQGIECTYHDLRRSFASILVNQGVSGFLVAEWLGDDVSVVQKIYGHLAPYHQEIARL
jgi:integrase